MPGGKVIESPEVSIVVPMFNEEDTLDKFFEATIPIVTAAAASYEFVCVNDGSQDSTLAKLRAAHERNPCIKVLDLSRNFGKEAALTAGLDHARGQAIVPMDVDLQDPPELITDLIAKWREGYDMVLAQRVDRSEDTWFKRSTAALFYKLLRNSSEVSIPENVGDFRLMDRRVVDALLLLPERTRFMKGLFSWLGFRHTTIPYKREARVAGKSKWRLWGLWNFALGGIISFSTFPLRIWTYLGTTCAIFAIGYMLTIIFKTLFFGVDVPGYASLLTVILFSNGLIMISLGILGEYIGRIFIEVKRRPIYLVRETLGLADEVEMAPPERPQLSVLKR